VRDARLDTGRVAACATSDRGPEPLAMLSPTHRRPSGRSHRRPPGPIRRPSLLAHRNTSRPSVATTTRIRPGRPCRCGGPVRRRGGVARSPSRVLRRRARRACARPSPSRRNGARSSPPRRRDTACPPRWRSRTGQRPTAGSASLARSRGARDPARWRCPGSRPSCDPCAVAPCPTARPGASAARRACGPLARRGGAAPRGFAASRRCPCSHRGWRGSHRAARHRGAAARTPADPSRRSSRRG